MKQNKRLKLGVFSASFIIGIIAIAIALNMIVDKFQVSWDLTPKKIYSVSEQTEKIVGSLEQDITIYILDSEEGFPLDYKQIVQQYEKNSNHILIKYRDLSLYPSFANAYTDETEINPDSIIVVCGDRHVYLDSAEFIEQSIGANYNSFNLSYELEALLTAAINKVNDGDTAIIYQTSGHNELTLSSAVETQLMRDNYSLESVLLLNESAVPEDADILLINAPTSDFSKEDCNKIRKYLEQGGKVYYIIEAEVSLENLEALMAEYGIEVAEGIVMEQNLNMIYGAGSDMATATYILPIIEDTEITHEFYESNRVMIVPVAKGLSDLNKSDCTVTGLLATSDYAYSKVNLDSDYISREDDDILGPFYLAALAEKENAGSVLILSSSNVLSDEVDEVVSGNNSNFFLNGLNYLLGDTEKISIRGKEMTFETNAYTKSQFYTISGIAVIGMPALLLVTGIIIVVFRKKRSEGKQKKNDREEEISEIEDLVTNEAVDESNEEESNDEGIETEETK